MSSEWLAPQYSKTNVFHSPIAILVLTIIKPPETNMKLCKSYIQILL